MTATRWTQKDIARELGFSLSAVKKWRGHTLAALRKFDQEFSTNPTCPLPRNALPVPVNQQQIVEQGVRQVVRAGEPQGVEPQFDPATVIAWAERTSRRHPETGATTWPTSPGRPRRVAVAA